MFLTDQLLLYSVEQTSKLARTLTLTPLRKPRAEVQDEKSREAIAKRNLEKCVSRSWWVTPLMLEHVNVAQESSRVRSSRSEKLKAGKFRDALHNNRISRFLQSDDVRARSFDHFGDRFSATDSALANVVCE